MRLIVSTSLMPFLGIIMCLSCLKAQPQVWADPDTLMAETGMYDLVINEIMFDPSPVVGLPQAEYLELFNRGLNAVNLDRWKINDALIPDISILPGQYLILCRKADIQSFLPFGLVAGIANWDVLNNAGEMVLLTDQDNNIADAFYYSPAIISDPDKRMGGWSIELVNPRLTCKGKYNWNVSSDPSGGTPGKENSNFRETPDTIAPTITGMQLVNQDTLAFVFSEPLDYRSALKPSHLLFNPRLQISSLLTNTPDHDRMMIILADPVNPGIPYEVYITGFTDCSGNPMPDTSLVWGSGKKPLFNDLLITELMVDEDPTAGLPQSEYIEIYNNTSSLIEFNGSELITDKNTIVFDPFLLFPHTYYLLCPLSKTGMFYGIKNLIGMKPFPGLLNDGQTMALFNPEGSLIFSIEYSKKWYHDLEKSEGGYSLEMIDLRNPCGEAGNWRASSHPLGGTPAEKNGVSDDNPDKRRPEIDRVIAGEPDMIKVFFSEKLHPCSAADIHIGLTGGIGVKDLFFNPFRYDELTIIPDRKLVAHQPYEIAISDVKDCVGNRILPDANSLPFQLPSEADSGDIVINEIMFNPRPGGVDWVEIYNRSSKFLQFSGYKLGNRNDIGQITMYTISQDLILLNPHSWTVITRDADKLIADFPQSDRKKIIGIQKMPALPDQFGNIMLLDSESNVFDEVSYSSSYHNPVIRNDEGVTLERISPDLPSNNPGTWRSASAISGYGTPTSRNSNTLSSEKENHFISLTPAIITPDGDGLRDELIIDYTMPKPGYAGNIFIYNALGQQVYILLKNRTLGVNGQIKWDGRDQAGQPVSTGYFIVYMEIYNTEGEYFTFKEKCAVSYAD